MVNTRLHLNAISSILVSASLMSAFPAIAVEQADTLTEFERMLGEVTVTGIRVPRLLKDTPVQTMVLSLKDITRADATDIQDLLTHRLPGVEFTYAMNQQTHMNFGGFGGQGVLFLIDGESLAGETMDDIDFSRIGMTGVERVEIVRGASSAIYGSSAAGGVINVITRRPQKRWGVNASVRVGRHNEQRYSLTASTGTGKFSNIITGSYHGIDNFDVRNGPAPATRVFSTVYGSRTWNVSDRLTVTPVRNLRLSAHAGYYFRQLERTEDNPQRYRDYTAGLRGEWSFGSGNDLNVSYAFDQYDKSDLNRHSGRDVRGYSNVRNTIRVLFSHSFSDGDILTAGADLAHDYLMNTKLQGRKRFRDCADAFVQYDLRVGEKFEAVGAVRYDRYSDGDLSCITPRVALRYSPARRLDLRLSYGMGFRAPSLKERYYDFDMSGIWIVLGNPALKPESSHNLNLSADLTAGRFNITATCYYNRVKDKITTGLPHTLPQGGRQLYLDYINLDGYSMGGFDLTVQGAWSNGLSARMSYAFSHERTACDKDGNTANNQYMPARPHSLTAQCDWSRGFTAEYTLTAGVSGRFLSCVSNREYRDYYDISAGMTDVRYPGYTIWKISCTNLFFGKLRVTLALDNIFNYRPKYYYLNSPATDGISLQAGIGIDLD